MASETKVRAPAGQTSSPRDSLRLAKTRDPQMVSDGHTKEVTVTQRGGDFLDPSGLFTPSIPPPRCTVYSVPAATAGPVLHCPLDGVQSAARFGQWYLDGPWVLLWA